LLALALAIAAALPAAVQADGEDPVKARATFAVLWERLQNSGFDGQHEGLDWAALKAEHQADIENARDIERLRREINELLADLKASHLVLLPAEAVADRAAANASDSGEEDTDDASDPAPTSSDEPSAGASGFGEVGLQLALFGGRLRVERVVEGSAAQRAGVRPGWAVDRIGKLDMRKAAKAVSAQPAEARRRGETLLLMGAQILLDQRAPGERVAVRFRDHADKQRALTLSPEASANVQSATLPGLPPMALHYRHRRLALADGSCVLHVQFSQWAMPVFDKMVQSLREHGGCRGVVLDLRGNTGGLIASISAVGGLFVEKQTSFGTLSTGGGNLKLFAIPRVVDQDGRDIRRFAGPVAVLTDAASVSCSDMFAAGMQALQRARVFGTRSAGMALPAASTPLPSGDRLMYPIADFVDAAGRRIEGVGVVPDELVVPTVAALSAGGDPVLDRAVAWLGSASASSAAAASAAPPSNALSSPSSSTR
jgi:carboxyl-terminal processing protease